MKILFLICLTYLSTSNSFSQIDVFNQSLKEPTLKLLYAGHPNTIVLSSELKENQILSSTGSDIKRIDSVTFTFTPRYSTGMDTISIKNENHVAQTDYFRILNMPVASIQIGSITPIQKFVTIKTILSEPFLTVVPNGLYIHPQTIISFYISIYDVNDDLIESIDMTDGDKFTPEQIERIKKMNPGDQLEISRINVEDFMGISRILQGCRISIK